MTSPKGLPLQSVRLLSAKLWEDKKVIDEFIMSGYKKMNEEETAIVSSWKRVVHGRFIVDRHLRKGSVLISVENNEVYIVKGIYSSWREMLENYPMPQIVEATLIPFRDTIIHDGIVAPYGMYLGRNMSEQSKQIYLEAKTSIINDVDLPVSLYGERQGSYRSKSMYITKDGEAKAKELMEKYGIEDW